MDNAQDHLIQQLNSNIVSIKSDQDYDALIDRIADANYVLLGEETHGTLEFYRTRMLLSQKLIAEKGFMAVAIEGDWPDTFQVHRYINGDTKITSAEAALTAFKRFPTWMWRNKTIVSFISWLKEYNLKLKTPSDVSSSVSANTSAKHLKNTIGFYGLDIYSLYTSIDAVIRYLNKTDPDAAQRAMERYACFDHVKPDPQNYGYLTSLGIKKNCIKEAIDELIDLQNDAYHLLKKNNDVAADEYFHIVQNARVIKNAENYYRVMFEDHHSSWNVRDSHMAETIDVLKDHLENKWQRPAKIIIWAHNSHVGDARATEMGSKGELNIGQLVREKYGHHAYLIGFSTYNGTVIAADNWGEQPKCKTVTPGLAGSYEALFHDLRYKQFYLNLKDDPRLEQHLQIPRLQRAIGVIYRPETERTSHYYFTRLPNQFDIIIHIDQTTALSPLDISELQKES